jgi:nitrous oxidase accessory protein
MRRPISLPLVLMLATLGVIAFLPVKAEPKTITVPDDYSTISAAIAGAGEGDTIFVKKGTYQEQTLEINKSLIVLGEDVDETVVNLDPPLVETMIFHNWLRVPSTAITIQADNVKLQGLTINMTEPEYGYGSGLSAFGDRIEIIGNKIGKGSGLQLSGSFLNVSENSLSNTLVVLGSSQTIAKNLIEGYLKAQGSFNRINDNTVGNDINLNGSFNLVIGNTFSTIALEHSFSNFISNNSFQRLILGDFGNNCSNNTVCKNRINGPGLWGILMLAGEHNIFHDNLISNYADGYGIAIGGTHLVAEHNIFYRNLLMNNSMHVSANWEVSGAGNLWDNGKEGNYWDNYAGKDSNGDGIGDVPHTVEGFQWDDNAGGTVGFVFGQDNYPLIAPIDLDSVSVKFPDWASALLNPSNKPQTTEPFPTLPVVVVSVGAIVLVSVGLLVYFKKHKSKVG